MKQKQPFIFYLVEMGRISHEKGARGRQAVKMSLPKAVFASKVLREAQGN